MAIAYHDGSNAIADATGSTTLDAPAIDAHTGYTIIVGVTQYASGVNISGVSDTAGNTYTRCWDQESGDSGANHCFSIYSATNITGNASNVVTATFSSTSAAYKKMVVCQYSGLATSSVYDVAAAVKVDASVTDTHTTNSTATTTQNDELIFGFMVTWDTPQTQTATDPYFLRQYTTNYNTIGVDRIVSTTGTYSITTTSAYNKMAMIARTFKMASATPTIELEGFRFRNDDGTEATATWKADQDTNITLAANTAFRMRVILNATGDPDSIGAQAEFRHKPSGGSFGSWNKASA